MKKLLLMAFLAMFVFSCGNTEYSVANLKGIEFDSIVVDSVVPLTSSDQAPRCTLNLSLIYIKGAKSQLINDTLFRAGILTPDYLSLGNQQLTVKQMVDSFTTRYLSEYRQEYGDLYRNDRNHADNYNLIYRVTTKVECFRENTLTYTAHAILRSGSPRETIQNIVRNFDVTTGKEITLDRLFANGYKPILNDLIVKALADKFDVENQQDLEKLMIFADGYVYPSENFIFRDDAITFIYAQDEIAPHDKGEIRIDIDKDDLEHILR